MYMHTVNLGRHKFLKPFEQLSYIKKVAKDYKNGQIRVFSLSQVWTIHLDNGQIIYACQSKNMWELFNQKLQIFNQQIQTLNNQVFSELKTIFDRAINDKAISNPDYMAICWLVKEQYLNRSQARKFIAEIVIEVMESFLELRDGIYEFAPQTSLGDLPKFYYLDISLLMARCQERNGSNSELQQINRPKDLVFSGFRQQKLAVDEPRQNYTTVKQYTQEIPQEIQYISKPELPKVEQKLYKILCIDDSPTILKAIQGFLDEELFEVIAVNDSLKALMQILRTKPDVILLDISMPLAQPPFQG